MYAMEEGRGGVRDAGDDEDIMGGRAREGREEEARRILD